MSPLPSVQPSRFEGFGLQEVYQDGSKLYIGRLTVLTTHLKHRRLYAVLSLCRLDFVKG